ncbi:MAG: serine hydrolase domain-containing protein, partial [Thermomicrobiales bacterium]
MLIERQSPHTRVAVTSRRRLISGLLAATLAPVLREPWPSSAQTPIATPSTTIPNTLAPDASPHFRAVAERLMEAMTATGTPGAALGILAEGREEHAAFGVESIDTQTPVTLDTLFQTGSVTKTVTGTAIMRLVELGTLDLDATVRTYLPEFRLESEDVAAQVTLRHLLTHSGGWWGDFFTDTGSDDDAIEQYVARWFPRLPQLFPLGEFVSYNNSGFTLLGRLIEVATGQTYRDAAREMVLGPLGLDGSFYAPDEVEAHPHALGHITEKNVPRIQEPLFLPRSTDPAGGLWSTTPDLLRYARFHLGDGTVRGARILSRASLDEMQTAQQAIPLQPTLAMGLPWFLVELPGHRFVTHEGGTFGQTAQLWLEPESGFALALLLNGLPSGALATQETLVEVFVQYFDFGPDATQMATPAASPPPAAEQPADLEQYAGRYEVPDATYVLRVEDDTLVISFDLHPLPEQIQLTVIPDLPAQVPLEFIAEDLALMTIE